MKPSRLSPSLMLVAAVAALCLTLGGGIGYAAGSLPAHSVGVKQLKRNAVTGKAMKADSVTGDKVADGSLSGADLTDGSVGGTDLGSNSVTGAQIDESTLSIPLKPGSVLLSGLDFAPRDAGSVTMSSSDGGVSGNSGVLATYVDATVHLPVGATVTHVTMYLKDEGADLVSVFVTPVTPAIGTADYSHQLLTTGASPGVQAIAAPTTQPGANSVLNLLVLLPTGFSYGLYGAKVDYS